MPYNSNAQIISMHGLFPRFKCKRGKEGVLQFEGPLFVLPEYDEYQISIKYQGDFPPEVRILDPLIGPGAPHVYDDNGKTCLYHPDSFTWRKEYLVSHFLTGWVAGWILFYEIWKETGKWVGPEDHGFKNKSNDEQSNTPSVDA